MSHIKGCVISNIGKIRANNEDNFCLFSYSENDFTKDEIIVTSDSYESFCMACVCDGMGGEEAGEEASKIAVSNVFPIKLDNVKTDFVSQLCAINEKLQIFMENNNIRSLGTTITSVFIDGENACFSNLGDSRGYFYRNNSLRRMSVDHSVAARIVETGVMTEEEAKLTIGWHSITRFLGGDTNVSSVDPHFSDIISIKAGDIYMLCSDGLTDMLSDSEIEKIISEIEYKNDPQEVARVLVDAALDAGGRDNTTVLVLMVE